jgi:hypothetical protein
LLSTHYSPSSIWGRLYLASKETLVYKEALEVTSNLAAILTAVVGTLAYGHFIWEQRRRLKALENYLRREKQSGDDQGRRTVVHLMSNLAMTEAEILRAGFQSGKIQSATGTDHMGRADGLYFQYIGNDLRSPQKF